MPDSYKVVESYVGLSGANRESTIPAESVQKQAGFEDGAGRRHNGGTEAAENGVTGHRPAKDCGAPDAPRAEGIWDGMREVAPDELAACMAVGLGCDLCGEGECVCVNCAVCRWGFVDAYGTRERHPDNPAVCIACYEAPAASVDPWTAAAREVDPADPHDPDARSIAGMGLEHGWDRSCHEDIVSMLADTDPAGLHHYAAGLALAWFIRTWSYLGADTEKARIARAHDAMWNLELAAGHPGDTWEARHDAAVLAVRRLPLRLVAAGLRYMGGIEAMHRGRVAWERAR